MRRFACDVEFGGNAAGSLGTTADMTERLIENQADFEELCTHIISAGSVAFDTEFVSEYTYRPELCLLQFATQERMVAVDPYRMSDLSPWWSIMTDDKTVVVVHGGQAEVRFCLHATGLPPKKLVDVQIAEGMRSVSYPLGYAPLVKRVLDRTVHGKETRTDWRRRPLSRQQTEYALEDVEHVLSVWEKQKRGLEKQGRTAWAQAEFQRMIDDIQVDMQREGWRRLPGIHRLNRRELAVAIKISNWREDEAGRRDRPLRSILRDDLIIDLARRQPKTTQDVLSTRDMNRPAYKKVAADLVACIQSGVAIPEAGLVPNPGPLKGESTSEDQVLGQLLAIALTNCCVEKGVSRQLVGTSADLRQLVRWHIFGENKDQPPRLMQGWREEVCGDLLIDLLDGKTSLRVADPSSDHPLVFEKRPPDSRGAS